MTRLKLQHLWKNRRRECILVLVVMMLALISLLVNMGSISRNASRSITGPMEFRKELMAKQTELLELVRQEREIAAPIRKLALKQQAFWKSSAGVQIDFRRKVERLVKESELRLKSLGIIQNMKIADGLNAYEITLTADAQLQELLAFMVKVEQETPLIYWENITITPDIRSPNFLILNAKLKIVVLDAPDIEQRLWGR